MRPLFRSLFVLSLFAVLAAHVSTGLLRGMAEDTILLGTLDRGLRLLLIDPFGRDAAVYALLGLGMVFAIWAYVAGVTASRRGKGQSFSTW